MGQVEKLLHDANLHILAITESWLTPSIPTDCISLQNYNFVRNDRALLSERNDHYIQGGGVACYLHNSLTYNILDSSDNTNLNSPEFLILDVKFASSSSLLLAIIYRRPNGAMFAEFINKFNCYLSSYKNVLITGDLNCNLLSNSYESIYLKNFIADHSMYLVPHSPTHHVGNAHTHIDVMISDSPNKIQNFYQSQTPFIAGHDFITVVYKVHGYHYQQKMITTRNFKNCNIENLSETLKNMLDRKSLNQLDVRNPASSLSSSLASLNNCINDALDIHAPFITRKIARPLAPWLTYDLKVRMKIRDDLYKRAKRTRNNALMRDYRLARKRLKLDIRTAKNRHLVTSLADQLDSAKIWSILKKSGLVEATSQSSLQHFAPEELNSYYATVMSAHPPCTCDKFDNILQTPSNHRSLSFSFSLLDHVQVLQMLISSIPKSRGISPDGIQISYLQHILPIIVPSLTRIYNLSIIRGQYPSVWKASHIIPLNKVPVPQSPAETRPIANLPHLAKSFDALITRQIISYLESNKLLDDMQSGFRRNFSTQTALLKIMDDIRGAIDQGYLTILVLFDFSKAFDTLSHTVILSCLRDLGFSDMALLWVFSYLTGRTQTIRGLDNVCVPSLPCTAGVPQGSSPGPILFIIVINTLFRRLKYCKCGIFADDTQFYLSTPLNRLNQTISELNHDIASLVLWAKDVGLKINPSKTKAIIIGSSQKMAILETIQVPCIVVDGMPIQYSDIVKNLGVHISSDLSWNRHISQISTKVHHTLYRLKFRGSLLPSPVKLMLVNALILPHFDYACLVYDDVPGFLNTKLQRLLNVALRFIYNLKRDENLSPFMLKSEWMPVDTRRKYFLGSLMYQILHTSYPPYLRERFIEIDPGMRRSSRLGSSPFQIPICRTDIGSRSFWIKAIHFWNSLPYALTSAPSLATFKSALLTYLKQNVR